MLTENQMHNLKVESYVLFGGLSEDFGPRHSISDNTEKIVLKREGGEGGARRYRRFAPKTR